MGNLPILKKLLVILGPTATGKTDMALNLAKKFNGELVSCDSRQVYTGLDIGTGKLPSQVQISNVKSQMSNLQKENGWWEIDGIKVWMYDVVDPQKQYSVADYIEETDRVIKEIKGRKKLPIVVGGTGLYLKALLYGLSNLSVPIDITLRRQLEKLSLNKLQEKLQALSIKKWEKMNYSDRQNPRRLIRAIELEIGKAVPAVPLRRIEVSREGLAKERSILKIGLTAPRNILYRKVNDGVVNRINQGMIEEAKRLHKEGLSLKRMRQLGLEYVVLADYLSGNIREVDGDKGLIAIMQGKIHAFVRRQLTWFKKERKVRWFDITKKDIAAEVETVVAKWYYPS